MSMDVWVVYRHPKDYPRKYVARLWQMKKGDASPTRVYETADTLEGVRKLLPRGLVRLERSPSDEPHIVETWI